MVLPGRVSAERLAMGSCLEEGSSVGCIVCVTEVLSSSVGSAQEMVQTHYLHCLQLSIPATATSGKEPLSWEHVMEASFEQNVAGLDFPSSHTWGCGENFISTAYLPSPHVAAWVLWRQKRFLCGLLLSLAWVQDPAEYTGPVLLDHTVFMLSFMRTQPKQLALFYFFFFQLAGLGQSICRY